MTSIYYQGDQKGLAHVVKRRLYAGVWSIGEGSRIGLFLHQQVEPWEPRAEAFKAPLFLTLPQ
jgi:hypothetical protein